MLAVGLVGLGLLVVLVRGVCGHAAPESDVDGGDGRSARRPERPSGGGAAPKRKALPGAAAPAGVAPPGGQVPARPVEPAQEGPQPVPGAPGTHPVAVPTSNRR
jgi:hypothetical protein